MDTTLTLLAAFSLSVAAGDPSIDTKALTKKMNDERPVERPAPVRKGRTLAREVMAKAEAPLKTTL